MQDVDAQDFAQTRLVQTGWWLGRAHQGAETGTLVQRLVVGFSFDELGADRCGSGYIVGNHASAAFSPKVGYVDDGRRTIVQHTRRGTVGVEEQRVVVTPAAFVRPDAPVSVTGAEVLRRFLGIKHRPAGT